ncbi:MAG: hypothetical protein RJA59_1174 [Pseudomonadota bacterium]
MKIETRDMAVAVLRADYDEKVAVLVDVLRAWPVPAHEEACEQGEAFELRCQAALAATAQDAGLSLALTSHLDEAGEDWNDIRFRAALAVALDAAHLAGAEWFLALHRPPSEVAA